MSNSVSPCLRGAFVGLLLLAAGPGWAQGAADRVFPPGGQRGTTVTLTFGGMTAVESGTLVVDGPGVKPLGPFVKGVGKMEIAADAEPGLRQVRLVGPKTASSPRPFMVGTLPEVLETEPNEAGEQAALLPALPLVLNGSLAKSGDTDLFRIALKKGDCLVAAGESKRTAGPVNLALYVRDSAGRRLGVETDVRKRDVLHTCTIPADGEYQLQLHEVTNNMGSVDEAYHYRLLLTTGPWLDYLVPAGGPRGQKVEVLAHGWNLGGKPGPGTQASAVEIPKDAPSPLLAGISGAQNRVPFASGSLPEARETEPNDTTANAQPLAYPITVNGGFGKRGDPDQFQLTVKKGETLRFEVDARELDSFADPVLSIRDASGRELTSVDDAESSRDPRTVWTSPADGTYMVQLRDLAGTGRGGPQFFYRLSIAPVEPELRLLARDATAIVKPGTKAELNVTVFQSYQPDEVTLTVEGLPPGVTAAPAKVEPRFRRSGNIQTKIALTATAGAKPGFGVVRIVATTQGKQPLRAVGRWAITGDGGWTYGTGATDHLVVLVPAP